MIQRQKNEWTIPELEQALLSEEETDWDSTLSELMQENTYLKRGFSYGCWLSRTRQMKSNSVNIPYIRSEIGMAPPKDPTSEKKNRWGRMLYLSTDLHYRSGFQEVDILHDGIKATVGCFFVEEHLKLFDATWPFAMAEYSKKYGGRKSDEALLAMVYPEKFGDIKVMGYDADDAMIDAIRAGDTPLIGTIAQFPKVIGRVGLESAMNILLGNPIEKQVGAEVGLVSLDNIDTYQPME